MGKHHKKSTRATIVKLDGDNKSGGSYGLDYLQANGLNTVSIIEAKILCRALQGFVKESDCGKFNQCGFCSKEIA